MTGPLPAADPALIRGVAFLAPVLAIAALAAIGRPTRTDAAAAVVATAWSAVALVPVNAVAVHAGWWTFHAEGAVMRGLPVDLWIGWALLWGALPALLLRDLAAPLVVGVLVWLDLILMPLAAPVVRLGPHWMAGDLAAIATALVPAVLLARWTRRGERLGVRVAAQAVLAAALGFGLPLYLLDVRSAWPPQATAVGVQVLAVLLLPGAAAARELAAAGRGTPLPLDPPVRLVTGGPYAYVRNPMQTAALLGYLGCAVLTGHPLLLVAAGVAAAFGAGFAAWHEDADLVAAFGTDWRRYQAGVRAWLPRWRPWPGRPPGVLYVAGGCSVCSGVGAWIARRGPTALTLRAAEDHPDPPRRALYEGADGVRASGVAALARALEHLHLGWALVGWTVQLPGVAAVLTLPIDAFGGGPRTPHPHRSPARPDLDAEG
jgi:protein-S-isoprenylcysteine O-methyltransferase Ste14